MAEVTQQCCTPRELELLLDDALEADNEQSVLRHMDHCPKCQKALEDHAAARDLWDDLPAHLSGHLHTQPQETHEGEEGAPAQHDASIKQLLEYLGPTDHPNMLGRIGNYEICGVVGRGSTGIVVKSFETSLNRYVAIKVLSPALSSNGAARRRFEREARAIAAVIHEHVVPIFAVDEHQGLPYFVMQYVAGASLQHRIERQGPLNPCEIVRIGMQVALGLGAAHAQGIVHRDIKPANILLEHGLDRALVTDFGLARVTDGTTMTMSGVIAGTPSYMAPEQARGEHVDQRSDLFSLGSVMYAMSTARPPFQSETVYGVIRRICESQPRAIRETNPEVPDWLEGLVNKLLAKEKEDRFDSAVEVADILSHELAHLQNPTAVQAPPRPWLPKPQPAKPLPLSTRRWVAATCAMAATALLAIVAFGSLSNGTVELPQLAPSATSTAQSTANPASPSDTAPAVAGEWGKGKAGVVAAPAADLPSNAVALAYPIENIQIDGNTADWPAKLPSYPLALEVGKPRNGNADANASFRVGYNETEQALYVAVEVDDDSFIESPNAGPHAWNTQDGCELYIDKEHKPGGSTPAQYARYGESLNAYGSNRGVKGVDLIVGQSDGTKRIYEWRVRLVDGVAANRSLGLDVAVADKDQDGSFTWLTWGPGTQKVYSPDNCGDVLLVRDDTPLGTVRGQVNVEGHGSKAPVRVQLQSANADQLWTKVKTNDQGAYAVNLPTGQYNVQVADDVDHRFTQVAHVSVEVSADQTVVADAVEASVVHVHRFGNIAHHGGGHSSNHGEPSVNHDAAVRNSAFAYASRVENIQLDGDFSDWPEDMPTHAIESSEVGAAPNSSADFSASYRVAYNAEENAVYVAVDVQDDSLVIDPRATKWQWNAQDGCEVYLDPDHGKNQTNVAQYSYYGDTLYGPETDRVAVRVGQSESGRQYEWQIQLTGTAATARSIGFDVSVPDKDTDGTFTWSAWGPGTRKAYYPARCGNLLLVNQDDALGEVTGKVQWGGPADGPMPRICFQSRQWADFKPRVAFDEDGNYAARLPAGEYTLEVVGMPVHQLGEANLQVQAGQTVAAGPLLLAPASAHGAQSRTLLWRE